jgi:6-phosphogluconate dehydrogenase
VFEATNQPREFYSLLEAPRTVMGFPTGRDARWERHIDALLPHLILQCDLLIDAANSLLQRHQCALIMLAEKGSSFLCGHLCEGKLVLVAARA